MGIGKRKAQSVKRKVKAQSLKLSVLSFSFAFCVLSFAPSCFASNEAALVRQGNQLYNKDKIDEALKSYNSALTEAPESPLVYFNIGGGLYKKKQYKEAIEAFEKTIVSPDKKIEAKANYNIGNCKFKQGKLKEFSDLKGAIAEYRSSLDYYKRAMELDRHDKDAKFNHEFVEKLLKSLIDKQEKQQQKKEQQGESGGQSQEQKEEQKKQEEQKQQQQEQQKEEQKKQQQQEPRQQEQKKPASLGVGGDMKPSAGGQDKEMSKEEARVLLEDYRQQEQQDRQLSDKHAPVRYENVEKDW